ncbi:unnamed protein product [Amoebophrya sp. A120]|nr:unnamed protein product [Amoebophrya sp. A120]|eukprot:GSA120T00024064001.1
MNNITDTRDQEKNEDHISKNDGQPGQDTFQCDERNIKSVENNYVLVEELLPRTPKEEEAEARVARLFEQQESCVDTMRQLQEEEHPTLGHQHQQINLEDVSVTFQISTSEDTTHSLAGAAAAAPCAEKSRHGGEDSAVLLTSVHQLELQQSSEKGGSNKPWKNNNCNTSSINSEILSTRGDVVDLLDEYFRTTDDQQVQLSASAEESDVVNYETHSSKATPVVEENTGELLVSVKEVERQSRSTGGVISCGGSLEDKSESPQAGRVSAALSDTTRMETALTAATASEEKSKAKTNHVALAREEANARRAAKDDKARKKKRDKNAEYHTTKAGEKKPQQHHPTGSTRKWIKKDPELKKNEPKKSSAEAKSCLQQEKAKGPQSDQSTQINMMRPAKTSPVKDEKSKKARGSSKVVEVKATPSGDEQQLCKTEKANESNKSGEESQGKSKSPLEVCQPVLSPRLLEATKSGVFKQAGPRVILPLPSTKVASPKSLTEMKVEKQKANTLPASSKITATMLQVDLPSAPSIIVEDTTSVHNSVAPEKNRPDGSCHAKPLKSSSSSSSSSPTRAPLAVKTQTTTAGVLAASPRTLSSRMLKPTGAGTKSGPPTAALAPSPVSPSSTLVANKSTLSQKPPTLHTTERAIVRSLSPPDISRGMRAFPVLSERAIKLIDSRGAWVPDPRLAAQPVVMRHNIFRPET